MYFRNLPFRVIVPICYLMRLNVVFFGLIRQQKKNCGKKIHSRILFLGFEYFNAIYFSDLSIFAIFAPVILTVTIMAEYIHRNIDSELIAWKED